MAIQFTFRGTKTNGTLALVKEYCDPFPPPPQKKSKNQLYSADGRKNKELDQVRVCHFKSWYKCTITVIGVNTLTDMVAIDTEAFLNLVIGATAPASLVVTGYWCTW